MKGRLKYPAWCDDGNGCDTCIYANGSRCVIRDNRIHARKVRRMKRILITWGARAAVLLIISLIIVGIIWAIHAITAKGQEEDETLAAGLQPEVTTEEATVEILGSSAEPEHIIIEEMERPTKFQDLHSVDWDAHDSYLLAKIAMAEAEGEGVEGKAMVIMTVLNRVWAPGFEKTIEGVIMEHHTNSKGNEVYQFTPVAPGGRWYRVEPDAECYEALRMIMEEKWDESEGALYFEATWSEAEWHRTHLEYIKTVGNHNFYK